MALRHLEIQNFRCVAQAALDLDPRCTLIAGDNGSGKTTILEAIHVLSCGRSFRTPTSSLLVRHGEQAFRVVGRIAPERDSVDSIVAGVESGHDRSEVRIAGRPARGYAELAAALPVQVIDPEVHRLLQEGPRERRRFIDWGVFHVEHRFVNSWRRYQRALRQRNAALKSKVASSVVNSWNDELVSAGNVVVELRRDYLERLRPIATAYVEILMDRRVALVLQQGWPTGTDFATSLAKSFDRDSRMGLTTVGPHRADLRILLDDVPAKEHVSRGQQKLLAAALILAQVRCRASELSEPTTLLLDDPAAELDVDNLRRLLDLIAQIPAQLVVTALDPTQFGGCLAGRLFHVKLGQLAPVL